MRLIISTLLNCIFATASFAFPSIYWSPVTIASPNPHAVPTDTQLALNVNFGTQFTSITAATILLTFEDDLWDIGETIGVFFPGQFGSIGIASTAHEPYDPNSWSTTLMWEPAASDLLDGTTDFYFQSINGSVSLQSCVFEIHGEAVPEPTTLALVVVGFGAFGIIKRRTSGSRIPSTKCRVP